MHYTERYGIIMIVMLGETIDGIAVHTAKGEGTANMYAGVVISFLILVACKLLYFDCSVVEDISYHAMRVSGFRGCIWNTLQPPLACGFAVMGDALALAVAEIAGAEMEEHAPNYRRVLCWVVGCLHFMLNVLAHLHNDPNFEDGAADERSAWFRFISRAQIVAQLIATAVSIGLGYMPVDQVSDMALLAILVVVFYAVVAINLWDEFAEAGWPDNSEATPASDEEDAVQEGEIAVDELIATLKSRKSKGLKPEDLQDLLHGMELHHVTISVHRPLGQGFHAPHMIHKGGAQEAS